MRTWIVTASAVAILLVSCTTADIQPSATLTTLTPGADQWFRVTWEPASESDGKHVRLSGYVENTYGEAVGKVELLGQALDAGGNVVGQRIVSMPDAVPAFARRYYEIPTILTATQYRVSVWAYQRGKCF
jgi:hypothetical protein